MRIRVLSDLHLDFGPLAPPTIEADVVVLAGDIATGEGGVAWARDTFTTPIVYVLGNHEYYGRILPDHAATLTALGRPQVHVLEQREVEIGGVVFLGCTLWTDMALFGSPFKATAGLRWGMADYRRIHLAPAADLPGTPLDGAPRGLQPTDTVRLHRQALHWLRTALDRHAGRPCVIITHHAPSPRSLGEHDRGLVAAAYASRLDTFVADSGAALWIHGHTHQRRDYWLGKTRVVCNARGYADRPAPDFDPAWVVEIA